MPSLSTIRVDCSNGRRGASLIELLVVFFIIGIMLSLLLPALMSARNTADNVKCQNNVRQLGMALNRCIESKRRFPDPNRWTTDILKWMEEEPLADAVSGGIPPNANLPRPKLMVCPLQDEIDSSVPGVYVCHYLLIVDRPTPLTRSDRVSREIMDRPSLTSKDNSSPWYYGPEISFAEKTKLLTTRDGPHTSGTYYNSGGQTLGGRQ